MDKRNMNITSKVFNVLNNVKGFDVAMGNPQKGVIIARHEGINFYINIEPIFTDTDEGRAADAEPFEKIVKTHEWVWR